MGLDEYREQIDNIDKELVKLFEKRIDIALKIAKYKKENNMPILNADRENEVINKNKLYLENKNLEKELCEFFHFIMDTSKELQEEVTK